MRLADIELLKELMAEAEREALAYCEKEGLLYNGLTIDDDGFLAVSYSEEEYWDDDYNCDYNLHVKVANERPEAIFADSEI